jgi:hypothetical protein
MVSNSSYRPILVLVFLALIFASDTLLGSDKWTWSNRLPAPLTTEAKRANRTPAAVAKLFRGPPRPPSMQETLDFLGLPEAFSPQFMYSKTEGTGGRAKKGGTLRFLLEDGSEVHVWTSDFRSVGLAIRYRKKGKAELLFK